MLPSTPFLSQGRYHIILHMDVDIFESDPDRLHRSLGKRLLQWWDKTPLARAFVRLVIWAGTVPFSTLLAKVTTFGLPVTVTVLLLIFGVSVQVPLPIIFFVFLMVMVCREIFWSHHKESLQKLQHDVQSLVLSEKVLARSFVWFAERVTTEWRYKKIHMRYWIDEDPVQGRFSREMIIAVTKKDGPITACTGKIRIGAQGNETELQHISELELQLRCLEPDAYALLLPLEVDEENQPAGERWHIFTILVYAAPTCGPELHLELTGNWRTMWAPFHTTGCDRGRLSVDKTCDELIIDVLYPPSTEPDGVTLNAAIPHSQVEACAFDSGEKRFRGRIVVRGAAEGDYHFSVEKRRSQE